MDGFSRALRPPPAYEQVQWLADSFATLMGLGWIINYALMVRMSIKGEPHSMPLIPLCNNFAWELAYTIVYPSANRVELSAFAIGAMLNLFIMAGAVRSARIEWRQHSPMLANHAYWILLVGVMVCFSGHVALAMEIGPGLAYSWGAVVCQLALSVGDLCQLLKRNSTAGTSWMLWSSRFLGSCCTVGFAFIRCKYWPEAYGWLLSPLILWSLAVFLLADVTYGVRLLLVTRAETPRTGKLE
ncbi:hypothetical protein E4U57_002703 [Claviceps arundinis]|uniref:IdtB n=1 Tax=Claviceps arundinis TaxID=1623583 RepID=A0A9P7SNQ2_9HYPO|nr:hypothetical protein E4U57_002703 [Claviceps arundinis]KAG5963828.1 hypothetical protein E4U56_002570 [Claviceps arundinis]UGT01525.1 IdtB [Claviceps arundinis]UGT01575.1 IdtB [Claviceps arundinis]